jgi:hypothetical protein
VYIVPGVWYDGYINRRKDFPMNPWYIALGIVIFSIVFTAVMIWIEA